ncbi:signal recognition particle receptor subunit beta [Sporothrix brasiliensis 5110]|uniref:Signal recognition particle receptor subunit beta n=1 Tax=Sporothrix brasiliensis 5110 TaxID=1398154 RepID=A0A0C2IF90_9PEZI|nr:signal recognition particle receptor subunit beta [Sporothrix brasiliensis 5110]KIH87886.1 signal recognition particle receptor subunit beta [Sporothrix brasiliensis 5110]
MDWHSTSKDVLEFLLTPSTPVIVIGLATVLLFPIFLHWLLSRSTAYITLPSVLIAGPPGAGKTALVTRLERRSPKPADTYTSQTANVVELAVNEDGTSSYTDDLDASGAVAKKFLAVDTPGHGKLRGATLARLSHAASSTAAAEKTKVKAVVYMVDGAALSEDGGLAAAASYLYDILLALQKRMSSTPSSKAPPGIPVLVAANKADLFTALPAALVRTQLEAELGRIRSTRSKGLLSSNVGADDVDSTNEADEWLGEYGSKTFQFSQMREFDTEVDVIAGNVAGAEGAGPGVDKWWTWIASKV